MLQFYNVNEILQFWSETKPHLKQNMHIYAQNKHLFLCFNFLILIKKTCLK